MEKAVVLLSSGLDSTINLYRAKNELSIARVITFDYGQRAAAKEISRSRQICEKLNLEHQVIKLDFIAQLKKSSLIDRQIEVPKKMNIDSIEECAQTAQSVWVPNRNGVFLNIAAAIAEATDSKFIIPGFNYEEAQTFPDNSKEYLNAVDKSLYFSTLNRVKTLCFTTDLKKDEIVRMGQELEVPFHLVWPCYYAGDKICGECESCLRFKRACDLGGLKAV